MWRIGSNIVECDHSVKEEQGLPCSVSGNVYEVGEAIVVESEIQGMETV